MDQENSTDLDVITGTVVEGQIDNHPRRTPLYISKSPLGVRARHRYHRDLNKFERETIPVAAKQWDGERKALIVTDEWWADQLLQKARELGFIVEDDDFTADTRRPKGYRRTWADTLAGYIPFEDRAAVLGDVADVLERHARNGTPKAAQPATQIRKFMEWGA